MKRPSMTVTATGLNNQQDRHRYHHKSSFPANLKNRRNDKSLVLCVFVLLSLLLTYISTLYSAIQMQADTIDADADNGRLKTKSKNLLSKNIMLAEKNELVLKDKEEEEVASKLAKTIGSPSRYSLPLHDRGFDHDKSVAYTAVLRSLQELTRSPPLGSIVCPSPHFTPIYDKIVYTISNNTNTTADSFTAYRKIPRIIHFSFNDRCVPNELAESITRWQETLPDHSIFFHDDKAVQRLIGADNRNSQLWHLSEDFPRLRNSLQCVKFKGAMLIDIWRMLVVWTYGGIYTDLDNWPGPKFNALTTIRDEDSFFSLSDGKDRPTQWLFGMSPKHPIAIFTLQDISRRLLKVKNIARPRVVHITGPQTLKVAFRKFKQLLEQNARIFGNSSYYTQVQKIDQAESGEYAKGNLGDTFNEIVDHYFDEISNTSYTNITKRKKTELLSGVVHWTEDVKLGQRKENETSKELFTNDTDAGAQMDAIITNNANAQEQRTIPYDGLSCSDYLATLD
jgi:mannosyltransferase OCH1-like enzyme